MLFFGLNLLLGQLFGVTQSHLLLGRALIRSCKAARGRLSFTREYFVIFHTLGSQVAEARPHRRNEPRPLQGSFVLLHRRLGQLRLHILKQGRLRAAIRMLHRGDV